MVRSHLLENYGEDANANAGARMPRRMLLPRRLLMPGYQEDTLARKVVNAGIPRRLLMLGSEEDTDASMPRRMLNPDAKKVIDARMPMRCQVDMKDAGTTRMHRSMS